MPIYEYRCGACGHELESLQKITEPPLTECPSCHEQKLTKLVSAAGFQLKGSGWDVTDFRNGSKPSKKADKPADGADKGNGAKAESGTGASGSAEGGSTAKADSGSGSAGASTSDAPAAKPKAKATTTTGD
jgi:putative FmdB family regulatory protein